jgi:hypothetical protein
MRSDMIKTVTVETKTKSRGVIPPFALCMALGLPDDARLYVDIPTGGDWSGMRLVIDVDADLNAEWTDTVEGSGYTQAEKITDMQIVGITNLDDIYHEHMGTHKKAFKAAKRLSAAGLAFIENSSGGPVVTRSCAGTRFLKSLTGESS